MLNKKYSHKKKKYIYKSVIDEIIFKNIIRYLINVIYKNDTNLLLVR